MPYNTSFDKEITKYPQIESYNIRESESGLELDVYVNGKLTPPVALRIVELTHLYFAEDRREYFQRLVETGRIAADNTGWRRFNSISITYYLDGKRIGRFLLDINERIMRAEEDTSVLLDSKKIINSDLQRFRQSVVTRFPKIQDVVVERMLLTPSDRIVKFFIQEPLDQQTLLETRDLVPNELLKQPYFKDKSSLLRIFVEHYVGSERVSQYVWDNGEGQQWVEGDWRQYRFIKRSDIHAN